MLTHWHPSLSNVLFDIFQCFFSAILNLLIILFSLASVVISNVFKWQTDQRESYSTVIKSRVKFWYFICSNDSIGCIYKRLSAFEAAPILLKAMGLVAKCRLGLNLMGFQSLSQREGGGRLKEQPVLHFPVWSHPLTSLLLLTCQFPRFFTPIIFRFTAVQVFSSILTCSGLSDQEFWDFTEKFSHQFRGGPHQYRFSSKRHCNNGM